jgi:hypothetical protein
MLTYPDFAARFPIGIALPMPLIDLYLEYVVREVQMEDYLDLFRGFPPAPGTVFARIPGPLGPLAGKNDHIDVSELGIPDVSKLHVGAYPWTLDDFKIKRKIKYVMIGECAKERASNTYIYDVTQISSTPYLNAPCTIFNVSGILPKALKLIELANNGVILIDIFPYGLTLYGPDRLLLQNIIWINDLTIRLNSLCPLYANKLEIATVAPIITSQWIIFNTSIAAGGLVICGINYNLDIPSNNITTDLFSIWSSTKTSIPKATSPILNANNCHDLIIPYASTVFNILSTGAAVTTSLSMIHQYRSLTVAPGTMGPNPTLLAFAFDL